MKLKKLLVMLLAIACVICVAVGVAGCDFNHTPITSVSEGEGEKSEPQEVSQSLAEQSSAEASDGEGDTSEGQSATSEEQSESASDVESASEDEGDTSEEQSASDSQSEEPEPFVPEVEIIGVTMNQNLQNYQANKKVKTEKRTEFNDLEQPYFVGDDNAFSVKPTLSMIIYLDETYENYEDYYPETWTFKFDLYEKRDNAFVLLEEDDVKTFVDEYDYVNGTVNFSEDAIGHEFRIVIYPEGLYEDQLEDPNNFKSWEVSVIDGYNVYSALELGYFDNSTYTVDDSGVIHGNRNDNTSAKIYVLDSGIENTSSDAAMSKVWADFREAKGLTENVNGLVLHTSLTITTADLPAGLFFSESDVAYLEDEGALGSLRDRTSIYYRTMAGEEEFTLEGNYFTIDASQIPLVKRFNETPSTNTQVIESHTQLFFVGTLNRLNTAKFVMKDVGLWGNAQRTEDTSKIGGLILHKVRGVDSYCYNNISKQFLINYFSDKNLHNYTVDKCKAYDSFTTMAYFWGAGDVLIKDSELIQAGGPAMIVDHVNIEALDGNGDPTWENIPSKVVVKNSEIHSYVQGSEAWFIMYDGASSIASQIQSMNPYAFTPFGKSMVVTDSKDSSKNFLDIVALYKNGAEGLDSLATKMSGYFCEDDGMPMDFGTYTEPWNNFGSPNARSQYLETIFAINPGIPVFMTSAGGMGFFSNQSIPEMNVSAGLNKLVPTGYEAQPYAPAAYGAADVGGAMFSGDQIYLYYQRWAIVFNYYNAGDTVEVK